MLLAPGLTITASGQTSARIDYHNRAPIRPAASHQETRAASGATGNRQTSREHYFREEVRIPREGRGTCACMHPSSPPSPHLRVTSRTSPVSRSSSSLFSSLDGRGCGWLAGCELVLLIDHSNHLRTRKCTALRGKKLFFPDVRKKLKICTLTEICCSHRRARRQLFLTLHPTC
jgi:hypothetical protein